MAFAVIIALYATIGLLAAAGSVCICRKVFSARGEQIAFALFLIPIAGFYLAFTAHFGMVDAWRVETAAVIVFSLLALVGIRVPAVLILGYALHGIWDFLHEIHGHGGELFTAGQVTEVPLAYGIFCLTYDLCVAGYFFVRRHAWDAAWRRSSQAVPGELALPGTGTGTRGG